MGYLSFNGLWLNSRRAPFIIELLQFAIILDNMEAAPCSWRVRCFTNQYRARLSFTDIIFKFWINGGERFSVAIAVS